MPELSEDVALVVDGQRYHAWSDLEIHRSLDGFSTIGFSAPFEPERREFRDTFRPFSFKPVEVRVNDALLFTGTLVGVEPQTEPSSRSVRVSAYSRPAVLADACEPASAFPLELNGLNLRQIAARLAQPFGIQVTFDGDPGAAFARVALKPDEKPHGFLVDLAKQRGVVISDTPAGGLRFLRSAAPGNPVARLREGAPPVTRVEATFQPQEYFSEITGLASARVGRGGAAYTARNAKLSGVVRPSTFTVEDAEKGDVPGATRAKLGRMFGNMVAYAINDIPTWRDPRGALWTPNTTITVTAPGAMIYAETELVIREVVLKQSASSVTASLGLVLPGAFSGEIPMRLPWEE